MHEISDPNLSDDNRTMRLRVFGHKLADDAGSIAGNG